MSVSTRRRGGPADGTPGTARPAAPGPIVRTGAAARRRPSRAALICLAVAGAILAGYLVVWFRIPPLDEAGSDFSASWVAADLWAHGGGGSLYDQHAESALHAALGPPGHHFDLPFITPPTTAVLSAPLLPFGLHAGYRAASLIELALTAAAVALALRGAPRRRSGTLGTAATGAVALAGVGTAVVLLQGQWDGVCALGLAAAYAAWRAERPFAAGLALALGMAPTKPHLALGLALFLVGWRERRALAGAATGAALSLLAGLPVDGIRGWVDWLGALGTSTTHSPLPSLLGYTGLFGSWLGDGPAAHVLAAVASCAAAAGCAVLGARVRRDPRRLLEPALAGAAALSLVAAPHLLMHDLAVLAPAAAWLLAWAASPASGLDPGHTLRRVAGGWLLLNTVAVLDLGNASMAPPGRLVPWVLSGLGGAALVATAAGRRGAAATARGGAAYSGGASGRGGVVDQS